MKSRNDRKPIRRAEAEERQAKRNSLSAVEQLKRLDRFGFVAKKERARLEAQIERGNVKKERVEKESNKIAARDARALLDAALHITDDTK